MEIIVLIVFAALLYKAMSPATARQETTLQVNGKPVVTMKRDIQEPTALEDFLFRKIFDLLNNIVPDAEDIMYECAKQGITVDTLMLCLKLDEHINDPEFLGQIERCYEYVCAKVHFSKLNNVKKK
jgi:hypothetical protein